jgi:hypothetical protein
MRIAVFIGEECVKNIIRRYSKDARIDVEERKDAACVGIALYLFK